MEIEIHIKEIKNGYTVWNNGNYDTTYCRNYDEVIETLKDLLKKYVKD